jgi:4,5-dihydroxyphthalate decarboxylase
MLLDGDIDAAILGGKMGDPRLMPLMPNSDQLTSRWLERSRGALPINHMVVVKTSLCRENPDAVREAYRMLLASKMAEQSAHPSALDFNPFGFDAIRPSLEFAIDMTYQQRLIPRRFDLDELFDDVTRVLEA